MTVQYEYMYRATPNSYVPIFLCFVGHSAKCGSYTVMDMHSNTIVDLQLVQVCNLNRLENMIE